jgi:uncharacterized protein
MSVSMKWTHTDGSTLLLLPQRAAFDPHRKALFIADAHFGKDAVFRAHGIPVPTGTNESTLARLDTLIDTFEPTSIVFLGDLLHGKQSQAPDTMLALDAWRRRRAELRLVMVEGNHDRHAGPLPASLGIELVREPWIFGPWALCHYPQAVAGSYALAGHEHPVYRLATRSDSVRLSCFRFGQHGAVLPAFGSFTGGFVVNQTARGETIYVIAGEHVMKVA